MKPVDLVVIGSGAGGLAASIVAASHGCSVTLLEASNGLGGYLNPFARRGFWFDTGLHFLGGCEGDGFLARRLRTLGVAERLQFARLDPEGMFRIVFREPGFRFDWPSGRKALRARLLETFPTEASAITGYEKALEDLVTVMRAWAGTGTPAIWARALWRFPWFYRLLNQTFERFLDGLTQDRLLRGVLAALWPTHGLPPSKASAFYHLAVCSDYDGAYYPFGGSRAFRDALVERARELGVEIRRRCAVRSVSRSSASGPFRVDTEDDQTVTATAVVSNADPGITYGRLLAEDLVPQSLRRRASRLKYSMSMFMAFLGVPESDATRAIGNRVTMHSRTADYDLLWKAMEESDHGVMLDLITLTSPSQIDPGGEHAPEGYHTVQVMAPALHAPFARWAGLPSLKRGDEYQAFKQTIGQRLIERVEEVYPGLTRGAKVIEFATPVTAEYWVRAPFGACYGPEQGPDQVANRRFSIASPVRGVFLAGAGTYGGGVSPCIASGIRAGGLAAEFIRSQRR